MPGALDEKSGLVIGALAGGVGIPHAVSVWFNLEGKSLSVN